MTQISPDLLQADLRAQRFQPVYFVLGPDEYRSREMVRLIKSCALDPGAAAFNFEEVSAAGTPARDALQAARTLPMMAPRRVLIVNDVGKAVDEDREAILQYVERPENRTVVVLAADDVDRRTTFYKRLRESACTVEFPVLKGEALVVWAGDYIRCRGAKAAPNTVRKIVDLIGGDLRMMTMEIEKLLLSAGADGVVADAVVAEMVRNSREHMSWDITKALGRGDRASALRILGSVVESDEAALPVLGAMARYYRQVLIAKEAMSRGSSPSRAAQAAGVHPAFAEKFGMEVQAIDAGSAARAYRKLARIDLRMKSSSVSKKMLLEDLICSL